MGGSPSSACASPIPFPPGSACLSLLTAMEKHEKSVERNFEVEDKEVQAVFRSSDEAANNNRAGGSTGRDQAQYSLVDLQGGSPSPMLQDRSDDDESDHTSDPYLQHMRGRVSPSPYTANTERARLFNGYVRGLIETKLDILVPISHQPRELVQEIIGDASQHFPEFASCVRKRIRTYLKSYRRSKRVKDMQTSSLTGQQQGLGSPERTCSPLMPMTSFVESSPIQSARVHQQTTMELPVDSDGPTTVVTITADTPTPPDEEKPPDPKKTRITTPPANCAATLSNSDLLAVRQLIQGYRESAAFLSRAADQLEQMLAKDENNTT